MGIRTNYFTVPERVRLYANVEQHKMLLRTLETANECANWISHEAWTLMQFEPDALHELLYTEVCRRFQLCAQLIVMMISLVADAYQLNHKRERVFAMRGAISYDTSMFSFGSAVVDIWTVGGCERIYLAADAYRDELLTRQRGRVDLIYRSSKWYLAAPCNRIDTSLNVVNDLLDVDISVNQSAGNFNGRAFLR